MLSVLTDPNDFFERRMEREERLGIPAFIVLLGGALGGVSTFLIMSVLVKSLSEIQAMSEVAYGAFVSVMTYGSLFSAVIISLIMWLVVAAVFYGISAIFGGKGSFKRMLEFVGYGCIPMIFGGIVAIAVTLQLVQTLTPPQIPAGASPEELSQIIQEWSIDVARQPLSQLSSALSIIFTIWCANIWIFAVKHARGITTKNALLTVGIPVGAYIAYALWQLLGVLVSASAL
ncbi:MAG: YIP1 family protein [Canidatus Methanoxibalbensis ujae]|nr:YIP1 family protein [Candidatus Methanoxibalbensis ujae]